MNDIPWWNKACVGVLGGIALALLKLIDAHFYVGAVSSIEVQAAYFTYGAYMALGGLAAVFLADHDLPPRKIVRSAFVIGLLAPSLLLALVSQPISVSRGHRDVESSIPKLSLLPFPSALAQEPSLKLGLPAAGVPSHSQSNGLRIDVRVVPKAAIEPSFIDAVRAALGRKELTANYVYVLGSTPDRQKAVQNAVLVNTALNWKVPASVIQLEGSDLYFVTLGGFVDRESALKVKADSAAQVAKFLAADVNEHGRPISVQERGQLAKLFADGPVVKTQALLSAH